MQVSRNFERNRYSRFWVGREGDSDRVFAGYESSVGRWKQTNESGIIIEMSRRCLAMPITIATEELLKRRLKVALTDIAGLCEQFDIAELSVFGSVLRDDFRQDGKNPSDVDLLVVFKEGHRSSWKMWLELQSALRNLFQREVDIVHKRLLKNPYRRAEILKTTFVLYEQG